MSNIIKISLNQATALYDELSNVATLNRREVVIHTGEHPHHGYIALTQWGGDDFYTLMAQNEIEDDGWIIPESDRVRAVVNNTSKHDKIDDILGELGG